MDPEIEFLSFDRSCCADAIKELQAEGWQLYTNKPGLFRPKATNVRMKSWTTIYIESQQKKIEPLPYIKQLIAEGWQRLENEEGLYYVTRENNLRHAERQEHDRDDSGGR